MTWRLILVAYTVLGLLFSGQVLIDYAYAGHPLPWWRAMTLALTQWYLLEVRDDGPGPDAAMVFRHGLQNTRARLDATHGAAASFDLIPHAGGGAVARIRMPMRPVEPARARP